MRGPPCGGLSVCLGAPVRESRPRLEPGCPLMRARWGHTSPVGRHLPALISDKGLSVPRTPALPHSSPATTSLSKPPLITRRGAGTGEARPGGGRSSDSLRPLPQQRRPALVHPNTQLYPNTTHSGPRPDGGSPGLWTPTGLPALPRQPLGTQAPFRCAWGLGWGAQTAPGTAPRHSLLSPPPSPSVLFW